MLKLSRTAGCRTAGFSRPLLVLFALTLPLAAQDSLPTVVVDKDDVAITKSCRIVVKKPAIADANGDGVIHVKAPNVVLDFDPATPLWGTDRKTTLPDTFTGTGVRIDGQKGVTLRGFKIRGFKVGIHASHADGLVIDRAEIADIFRHHLRSTPAAEDGADWLWPHENDDHQWRKNYGAAICIEDSKDVTVKNSTGRRSQNGIILDRVEQGKIYDDDFSFLSGWGLAMWRSSHNWIERNAFDFCIRGYSHGVYNRGQDSAGILMFEQCSNNTFILNSVTHGGDGVFGFAGKEALAESPPPSKGFDYKRRGCNDNVFVHNNLSYAAAHGLEMTFSFGNRLFENAFVENAICGIWGGYSQETLIHFNEFTRNGEMGYGLERGGVNIEHGCKNRIEANKFSGNKCGVHLWSSDNKDFPKKPWGAANYRGCRDNVIADNTFDHDALAVHLRSATATTLSENSMTGVEREIEADAASTIVRQKPLVTPAAKPYDQAKFGTKVPSRPQLRGRENIIMTEWGPWDHESPLVRAISTKGPEHVYALHALANPAIIPSDDAVTTRLDLESKPPTLHVVAKKPGVTPYSLAVMHDPAGAAISFPISGTIVSTKWKVRLFPTTARPHENPDAWKSDSAKAGSPVELDALDLKFGMNGPFQPFESAGIGRDSFGLIAETSIPLTRGKWRITTLSDDGVRVTADGKLVIDNWTWHGPTKDTAVIDLKDDKTVPIHVEYFELDGYAVLTLDIEKDQDTK